LPRLERFLDSIRHRHSRLFSLASSKRSSCEVFLYTRSTRQPSCSHLGLSVQVSLYSPLPSVSADGSYSVETLSRYRGLTRRMRLMAASFVSNHRVLFRQSGVSGAFHSSALYRLELFQTVPRRFLSRSFVLVGTNPGDRFLISLAPPFGLKERLLFSVLSCPGCSSFREASFQMSSRSPVSTFSGRFLSESAVSKDYRVDDSLQLCCCRTL